MNLFPKESALGVPILNPSKVGPTCFVDIAENGGDEDVKDNEAPVKTASSPRPVNRKAKG